MEIKQIKTILQGVVMAAALPITAYAETPVLTKPPINSQPCRTPPQKTLQTHVVNQTLPSLMSILSASECLVACRTLVERKYNSNLMPTLLRIENFKAEQCKTQMNGTGFYDGGRLSCNASFLLVQSQFTQAPGCYSPSLFNVRRRAVPGRLPTGITVVEAQTQSELGNYFAHMAAMETAAITAFDYLAQELEAYNAPLHLIQMAREAIQEETEHAAMATLLTQAYEGECYQLEVKPFKLRSFFEVALENAVEGCVNETFAAAMGYWQQEHAQLETFKQVIAHITDEESKHATLSWGIHEWALPQLSVNEQQQIREAQLQAIEQLEQKFKAEDAFEVRQALGMPTSEQAQSVLKQLRSQLWDAYLV